MSYISILSSLLPRCLVSPFSVGETDGGEYYSYQRYDNKLLISVNRLLNVECFRSLECIDNTSDKSIKCELLYVIGL